MERTQLKSIELADLLLIAEATLGIRADTLRLGYCRLDQALAALAVPFSGFADVEVHPLPYQKAAAYCSSLVRHHPFVDGNKRVAWVTMREFIARNGYTWTHGRGGEDEAVRAVEALTPGTIPEEWFANWVGHRMHDG
jgi:death-on-curing family protein